MKIRGKYYKHDIADLGREVLNYKKEPIEKVKQYQG